MPSAYSRGSRASASISGRLGLPGNDYVSFNVGRYNQIFVSPTAPELDVPAVVSYLSTDFGHGLFKNGSGQMRLGGNNGLTGEVDVNGGKEFSRSMSVCYAIPLCASDGWQTGRFGDTFPS
jgi:autotransporter-associated beta strand protein